MSLTELPASYPGTMTAEDYFVATEGDPWMTQLIDGFVVVNQPRYRHQRIVGLIYARLLAWIEAGGDGLVGLPIDVLLDDRNVFAPDVWWLADTERIDPDAPLDGSPDLAVEVRSPSTWRYDVGVKRRRYEENGVRELWLVDTEDESVLVVRRSRGDVSGPLDQERTVRPDGVLDSPLLAGFGLAVRELFPA